MDYNVGDIVISKAGRDKGSFLVVIGFLDDDKLLLADGRVRVIMWKLKELFLKQCQIQLLK